MTEQTRRQKAQAKPKRKSLARTIVSVLLMLGLLLAVGAVLTGCSIALQAPDVTKLAWNSSTVFYDRSGTEIHRYHAGENRTPVELKAIPQHVIDAFIAVEDPNFEQHHGIDPRGLTRAVVRTAMYFLHLPGGRIEGGSTITQQLARDAWLSQEVTAKRKIQEAWVAIQLERTYTKDQILEMYLNQIFFGENAYGIEAASRTFFGKEVGDLTIAEGAQLAGMINGPSIFNPYVDMEASLERRNIVLDAMLREKKISQEQYEQAKAETPVLKRMKTEGAGNQRNYFIDYAITVLESPELRRKYGIDLGNIESVAKAGLKIYTTMDPTLQMLAEKAIDDQMAAADKQYGLAKDPRAEAAMVSMNPKTGEILALVGGREYEAAMGFNRATAALRQPGSVIKPLVVYTPGLEAGLSPATIFDDAPVMLWDNNTTVWPQNFDFRYQGLKSMRYGVEQSINPIAVRVMQAAGGPSTGIEYAHKYGLVDVDKTADNNLALALGGLTKGTTVLDLTAAYSAIANMGTKVEPIVITRVEDANGQVVYEATPRKSVVIRQSTAYMMIDMMKDVIRRGTAYGFTGGFRGWPAAGKTGTTEDNRDAWFVGFTPDLVTTVWNGYDEKVNLKWTGAFVPVKIWNQFMTAAVTEHPADWPRPADVVTVPVCRLTGATPTNICPKDQLVNELFAQGTEPKGPNNLLVRAKVVQVTTQSADKKRNITEWQLWQPGCAGTPVERNFIQRPQPRVLHPTDPNNPKYVPADVKDELPKKTCQPASLWDRLFPKLPLLPGQTAPTEPDAEALPPVGTP